MCKLIGQSLQILNVNSYSIFRPKAPFKKKKKKIKKINFHGFHILTVHHYSMLLQLHYICHSVTNIRYCYECDVPHPLPLNGKYHMFCSRENKQSRVYKIGVHYAVGNGDGPGVGF